jgi:protocatechuate 3,4-dioxygenase beta subunit
MEHSPKSEVASRADAAAKSSSEDVVVDGRVVNAIGEPVAEVEIAWQVTGNRLDVGEEWPTTNTRTTDRDGYFAFRGLDLANGIVRARKPGFVALRESCRLAFDERRCRGLTLVLHEARSIHGTVVDENGRPVANAWVHGFNSLRVGFESPSTRTNDNGAFVLDALPLSDVYVNAFAAGYRPDHSDPISFGVDEVTMRVRSEPRTRLELTVVDPTGHPVSEAFSSFAYHGPPPSESSGYIAPPGFGRRAIPANGLLVRDDLPAGKFTFRALGASGQFEQRSIDLELRAGATTKARIEVPFGDTTTRIHGRLVRHDGTPIGNERVAVARRSIDAPNLATTDAHGEFEVEAPVPSGSSALFWSMGPSLALVNPDGMGGIAVTPVDSSQPVELVAEPTARLSGTVVDEEGAPVAGATLEIHGECRVAHDRVAVTSSGSDGAFVFDALAPQPEPIELAARHGRASIIANDRFTITSGAVIEHVTLTLPRSASIEGRVIDAGGRPLAGVLVGALRESRELSNFTDVRGRFRITGFSDGTHELRVTNDFYEASSRNAFSIPIHLDPAEALTGLEIRIPAPGTAAETISGRVIRSDGRLATDSSLYVILTNDTGRTLSYSGHNPFECNALKPATYGLRARVLGNASLTSTEPLWFLLSKETIATPGTADVTLVLPDLANAGALHAAFSAGSGKQAPRQFEWMVHPLSVIDPEGKSGFGQEAPLDDGEMSLHGFPPGDFRVEFDFESGLSIERSVTFRGNETVELGTIDLEVPARSRGFVVDPSGAPIEGVLVTPRQMVDLRLGTDEESVPDARNSETKESGADGGFDVALARGALYFFKPGYAPFTWSMPSNNVSRDTPLRITLLPGGHLRFSDVPPELIAHGAAFRLRWLAAETTRTSYGATETMHATSRFSDDVGIFNLPVGEYEVWLWTTNGTGVTLNSDTKPPTVDQPGVAHRWQVRIDAGETARIDVAKEW